MSKQINGKQKGKRIELEAVHLLQKNGCLSAHRTQQYAGATGTSDITAEELPNIHIEVKGTKEKTLTQSKLKSWLEQVVRDCPETSDWVILHKANGCDFVAIIPPCHLSKVGCKCRIVPITEESINIPDKLLNQSRHALICTAVTRPEFIVKKEFATPVIGFIVGEQVLFAMKASVWVRDCLSISSIIKEGI